MHVFFTHDLHVDTVSVLRREVALHEACKANKVDAVARILHDKIDINCKNNVRTALDCTV